MLHRVVEVVVIYSVGSNSDNNTVFLYLFHSFNCSHKIQQLSFNINQKYERKGAPYVFHMLILWLHHASYQLVHTVFC